MLKHEQKLLRPAKTVAEKMIKVDHTGENGGVNIYRAQHLVSHIRARHLMSQLAKFQAHEEEHREIFRNRLNNMGVRRCMSYHLSGLGGFVLGFVTGLIGPSAIAATTYAVEDVVLNHLEHQMPYLEKEAPDSHKAVREIYDDEMAHHQTAAVQMQQDKLLTKILVLIVKLCTQGVIRFGMR